MHARHPARLTAAVLLLAATAAACGAPERITPSSKALPRSVSKATPTVFPAPKQSVAPSASAEPSGAPASPSQGGGGGNAVEATPANRFAPEKLTVKAGTKVTWTANGFHSVTGGKDGKADPASPMKSELGFTTYSVTFAKPGTYPYFCTPHASLGMVGEITVT